MARSDLLRAVTTLTGGISAAQEGFGSAAPRVFIGATADEVFNVSQTRQYVSLTIEIRLRGAARDEDLWDEVDRLKDTLRANAVEGWQLLPNMTDTLEPQEGDDRIATLDVVYRERV